MNDLEAVRGLLQQALDRIDAIQATAANEDKPIQKTLSQKDYVPVVARVLARNGDGRQEMNYREIAKIIKEQRLIDYSDYDVEDVKLNSRENVPRMFIRVRDALSDTVLGKQFFERGSKKGYYRLSPLGLQFYSEV